MVIPARRRQSWPDMSDYVAHFTKATRDANSAHNMASILEHGRIEARTKFGLSKGYARSPNCVCLSEVPIHFLSRIMRRRGGYGLAFKKDFVAREGGSAILYAQWEQAAATRALLRNADDASPIWALAPFIDAVGVNYSFQWEREWRIARDLVFTPADVAFLMFPADEHDRVAIWLAEEANAGRLPRYECPLIDVTWPEADIAAAIA